MSQNEETEAYSEPESVRSSDIDQEKQAEPDTPKSFLGERPSSQCFQQEPNDLVKEFAKIPDQGGLVIQPATKMKENHLQLHEKDVLLEQECQQHLESKIKETRTEISRFRSEMCIHLELNKKLIRRVKDIDTSFNDVIAVAAGAEATMRKPQNAVQLQVVQKEIDNIKKEIVIFRRQIQVESDIATRNSLDAEGNIEKELCKLQLELQDLEATHSNLVNKVEAKERALLSLRNQIQSNVQLQLLEEIKRAEITLTKREKRLDRDRRTLDKDVKSFEAAERCMKLYDDLIRENYIDDD